VLNPVGGYLRLAEALWADAGLAGGWNFGPSADDVRPVRWIVDRLTALWPEPLRWELDEAEHPHEAGYLALDSAKARERLGWAPVWGVEDALARIVAWHRDLLDGRDPRAVTLAQIESFTTQSVAA
jgi:CDP-glucose 4,6-dehydratase